MDGVVVARVTQVILLVDGTGVAAALTGLDGRLRGFSLRSAGYTITLVATVTTVVLRSAESTITLVAVATVGAVTTVILPRGVIAGAPMEGESRGRLR